MSDLLILLLRMAGVGLLLLVVMHVPISRHLGWREDALRMTAVNASIFHVHAIFICVVLVIMALPCLFDPQIFLEKTRAGSWLSWSFAGFWVLRLYFQWFVYQAELWRGKKLETALHWWFSLVWTSLALLFGACGARQAGWL